MAEMRFRNSYQRTTAASNAVAEYRASEIILTNTMTDQVISSTSQNAGDHVVSQNQVLDAIQAFEDRVQQDCNTMAQQLEEATKFYQNADQLAQADLQAVSKTITPPARIF